MKNKHIRYIGKADEIPAGTFAVQTSGNTNLTGESVLVRDFSWHSYQIVPVGGNLASGDFKIDVSNDGNNWSELFSTNFTNVDKSEITYSNSWHYKYARPKIEGGDYNFIINESHLS